MLTYKDTLVEEADDGRIKIERANGGFVTVDADVARWLVTAALPAMIPSMKTAAAAANGRRDRG